MTRFQKASFQKASFRKASFQKASFQKASFQKASRRPPPLNLPKGGFSTGPPRERGGRFLSARRVERPESIDALLSSAGTKTQTAVERAKSAGGRAIRKGSGLMEAVSALRMASECTDCPAGALKTLLAGSGLEAAVAKERHPKPDWIADYVGTFGEKTKR